MVPIVQPGAQAAAVGKAIFRFLVAKILSKESANDGTKTVARGMRTFTNSCREMNSCCECQQDLKRLSPSWRSQMS